MLHSLTNLSKYIIAAMLHIVLLLHNCYLVVHYTTCYWNEQPPPNLATSAIHYTAARALKQTKNIIRLSVVIQNRFLKFVDSSKKQRFSLFQFDELFKAVQYFC